MFVWFYEDVWITKKYNGSLVTSELHLYCRFPDNASVMHLPSWFLHKAVYEGIKALHGCLKGCLVLFFLLIRFLFCVLQNPCFVFKRLLIPFPFLSPIFCDSWRFYGFVRLVVGSCGFKPGSIHCSFQRGLKWGLCTNVKASLYCGVPENQDGSPQRQENRLHFLVFFLFFSHTKLHLGQNELSIWVKIWHLNYSIFR